MLPPVIDVEFYGDKEKNPPAKDTVTKELRDMINALEKHYGLKPVLYVTEKSYDTYIRGDFTDYDIWFRNVISKAAPSDGRKWTFWQYTNREMIDGYNGKEKFIDMNVFNGSNNEFNCYPRYIKNTEP